MSRIGKLPVELPESVTATVKGSVIEIKGPKGSIRKEFDPSHVTIALEDNKIIVSSASNSRLSRAMWGTARSIIASMVKGVLELYKKQLEIHGVGFRANISGKKLNLNLGYSHDIVYNIPEGITVVATDPTKLDVSGVDKHMVGQVAADIKHYYPVEPYKGKGVRIVGQFVRRKEGKKAA